MKRTLLFILSAALIIALCCVFPAAADKKSVLIYETDRAPVIDGVLDDLYSEFIVADSVVSEENFVLSAPDTIRDESKLYACWDSNYLYVFAKIACNGTHVAYMDNETEHFIFNAHYLMTAICPDEPTDKKYFGAADTLGGWEWSPLYTANYMYEWTVIKDSRNGNNVISDHFGSVSTKSGFEFCVTSENGFDCYEQKIPLAQLSTSASKGVTPKVGSVFGYGFAAGLTDVGNGYVSTDDVVNYSGYFDTNKVIVALVRFELASTLVHGDDSSAEASDVTSEEASDVTSAEETSEVSAVSAVSEQSASSEASVQSEASSESESGGFPTWGWLVICGVGIAVLAAVIIIGSRQGKTKDK